MAIDDHLHPVSHFLKGGVMSQVYLPRYFQTKPNQVLPTLFILQHTFFLLWIVLSVIFFIAEKTIPITGLLINPSGVTYSIYDTCELSLKKSMTYQKRASSTKPKISTRLYLLSCFAKADFAIFLLPGLFSGLFILYACV